MCRITCIQCLSCGQIIAGDKPENLKRVCLECCERMKTDCSNAETPYITFSAEVPTEPFPCKMRISCVPDGKDCPESL